MSDIVQYDVFGNVVPTEALEKLQGVEGIDYVVSRLDGKRYQLITTRYVRKHGLKDLEEYQELFPDAPFECTNVQKKRGLTTLKNYGVENPSQVEEIKEKKVDTCLEHYGVSSPLQSELVRETVKRTNLERYGVENPMQNEDVQNKTKKTNLKRYGFECVFQSLDIQRKVVETNLKNLGVEYPMQSELVREKSIITTLEHYGVKNVSQSDVIKQKKIDTCLKNFGVEYPGQSKVVMDKVKQTVFDRYGIDHIMHYNYMREYFSILHTGSNNPNWHGGVSGDRSYLVSENWCVKLNDRFINSHGHHILPDVMIYIPSELHQHIWHNSRTGENMDIINTLAFQYLNGCYNG